MLAHIAIAVENVEQSSRVYAALGFVTEQPEVVEREHVRVLKCNKDGLCLELIEAYPPGSGGVAKFISKRGPGLHHIALGTECLAEDLKRAEESGISVLAGYPADGSGGSRVAFLAPATTGGVLIELVENKRKELKTGHDSK